MKSMRTTIEITDEQRSKLLEEAARLGEKGFSTIVQKALDQYFDSAADRQERLAQALRAIGSLSEPEASRLEHEVRTLRRNWR